MTAPVSRRALPSRRGWQTAGSVSGRTRWTGWLLVLPTLVAILFLGIYPLLFSLTISFRRWDLQVPEQSFVGLANYGQALMDDRLWAALGNTLLIMVVGVGLEFVLGLGLALVLIDELRGKRFIIPLLMLPVLMVPVVVALTWRLLWDQQYGPINAILSAITGQNVAISWLAQKNSAMVAIIVTEVWQWTPFMFLVLLAGLSGVSAELYDAASLDGASWWHSLRDITLPAIAPVIAVAVLFRAFDAFKIFDVIFLFTQGGPGTSTESISWYIYQLGLRFFRMGYAAAVSYLVVIFLTIVVAIYATLWLREERA
ncbi:MAG: sugar ABC transporter permease [Chloroflexia bacterium]|nr:sugar ABC transporter permease [Chloroflexia bacterium]